MKNTKQETLQNVNRLTFEVLKKIKSKEIQLIKRVLTKLIGEDYNRFKVETVYKKENTNDFELFYGKKLLGKISYVQSEGNIEILFKGA